MSSSSSEIFPKISADDPENAVTLVESLCVNCYKQGTTRLLLTKIPFYKDVIISSFECSDCGFVNNALEPASDVNEKGIRYKLSANCERDLNRQIVRSNYTSVKFIELDFEIPSRSQVGEITTLEGIINRCVKGLQQDQPRRKTQYPKEAAQIDEFIEKLDGLKSEPINFTVIFEDISGNTFVENPYMPKLDVNCVCEKFERTTEQDEILCIYKPSKVSETEENGKVSDEKTDTIIEDLTQEVFQFKTNCPNCGKECETNMKMTNIPYFKEVVIMATVCESCGHKTNEVKAGGGIEKMGTRFELKVRDKRDFSRDLLKSETCQVTIKELEIEMGAAALSGRFTTVEGLLVAIYEQLRENNLMYTDSRDDKVKTEMDKLLDELKKVVAGDRPITLVLDDPAGNSYIQSLDGENNDPDPFLSVTKYERSHQQNDDLGLTNMKVDNY